MSITSAAAFRLSLAACPLLLALRHHPELANVGRLTLAQSLGCIRLTLWDEAAHRLITFRELRSRGDGSRLDGSRLDDPASAPVKLVNIGDAAS